MTPKEIKKVIDGLFYKPGWTFKITTDWSDRPVLLIRASLLDSTTWPIDPDKYVIVVQNGYVPSGTLNSEYDVKRWLAREVQRLEFHEAREWLRSLEDGKPIDDPHAYDRREA